MVLRRLPRLYGGFAVIALGVALIVHADLGASPWDVLHQGISRHTPLSFGTAAMLVGFAAFAFWAPLHQRPGLGTICNVLSVGPMIDLSLWLLPEPSALPVRVAFLAVGTVLLGTGGGIYLSAGIGSGPRDGIMMGLAARGLKVRWVRSGMELTALTLGWLLGGTVGIGTLVTAFGLGHVIQAALQVIARIDGARDRRRAAVPAEGEVAAPVPA